MKFTLLAFVVLSFAVACSTAGSGNRAAVNQTTMTPRPVGEGTLIPTPRPNDAPRISLADAKKDFDAGTAVFIDTHAAEHFAKQHIPGAINISVSDLAAKEDNIPKGKKIIAYCSWANEHTSASLVSELHKKGYTNSYALLGGTQAWVNAGFPLEKVQ